MRAKPEGLLRLTALLGVSALALTACGGNGENGTTDEETDATENGGAEQTADDNGE